MMYLYRKTIGAIELLYMSNANRQERKEKNQRLE